MKKIIYSLAWLATAGLSVGMTAGLTACDDGKPAYQNTDLSPEERAEDLVSRLTLEEKVSLMMHKSSAVERLGIRQYNWWNEALHGVARSGLATVFPQPIGMAAAFDAEAIHRTYVAVSDEARAKNTAAVKKGGPKQYEGLTMWTPNVNIVRDPRWGRGIETYGEDPYLTSVLGLNVVKGLQCLDADAKYDKLHACAKHYAVHSGPEWNRHSFNAENIKPRDLYETYLPAFKTLVQKGNVQEVMCAYNRFEGEPCCGSNRLLTQILREEWGFKGVVLSDCWAVSNFYTKGQHETHPDSASAVADAVLSGTDLECGESYQALVKSVKKGLIKESDINTAVERLFRARFALGEMDKLEEVSWSQIPFSVVASKEHAAIALEMARKSMVLLQNKNNVLPLAKQGLKIAVMGPNANDSIMQRGNYEGTPARTVTILQGIKNAVKNADELIYEPGCTWVEKEKVPAAKLNKAVAAVKNADVVIFVGGISPKLEGEEMGVHYPGFKGGDRTSLELPEVQRDLLQALKKAGKRVVFVNCSGSAMGLVPETNSCDAILQAWYPGQEGGTAVADVLFGNYNPSGSLPLTFYKNVEQLPDFEDYNMAGRTYRYFKGEPLYPFGYGLSYTTFAYDKLEVPAKVDVKKPMKVSVSVTNTGKLDGDEIVQLYLRKQGDTDGPSKALRAFQRITLKAGETKQVTFNVTPDQMEWWDAQSNTMCMHAGTYDVMVGEDSEHLISKTVVVED